MEKFPQVEILVLERVRQFVRQHHFLHVFAHPICDQHGLAPRVVDARRLLRVEGDEEFPEVEVARHQAESLEHRLLLVKFARGILLFEVLRQVILDLGPPHDLLLERRLDGQAGDLAHVLEDGVGGREQRLQIGARGRVLRHRRACGSRRPGPV